METEPVRNTGCEMRNTGTYPEIFGVISISGTSPHADTDESAKCLEIRYNPSFEVNCK